MRMRTDPKPLTPIKRAAYSIEDAAQALGIGRSSIFILLKDGTLNAVKVGRRTLIPVREIDALLDRLQKVAR